MGGLGGTREDFGWFRDRLNPKIVNEKMNKFELIRTTSDLIIEGRRKNETDEMELLLGIRAKPEMKSQLFYFNAGGGSQEIVEEKVIGQGEPVGRFFLKEYFRKDLPMLKVATLGTFIIKFIEKKKLDNTVGFGDKPPTIWWIPDLPEGYTSDADLPKGLMSAFVVRQEESSEIEVFRNPIDRMVDAWIDFNEKFFGDSFET